MLASSAALVLQAHPSLSASRVARAPLRCADFLDTIGANLHLGYPNTGYDDVAAVIAAMKYCGIRFARDSAVYDRAPNAAHYRAVAASGVKFCMFWGPGRSMSDEMRQLDALEADHPGAVWAMEGPNEIKPSFSYAGLVATPAAEKFMSDMRAEASRYDRLRNKPIVRFTDDTHASCDCDFANLHIYPKGGQQPGALIRLVRDRWIAPGGFMSGKGMVFTEFGYHSLVGKPAPGAWQGVDEERQAILLLNGWFAAAAAGVTRTFAYELLDEHPGRPGARNMQDCFGLFRADGTPKLAAAALRRLSALLADRSARAREFQPAPVAVAVEGAETVASLRLRNAQGQAFLCLWNEAPVWDANSASPLPVTPTTAIVTLPARAPVKAWDPVADRPPMELGGSSRVAIELGAHPIVLQIA
jgi:hypothetical protein